MVRFAGCALPDPWGCNETRISRCIILYTPVNLGTSSENSRPALTAGIGTSMPAKNEQGPDDSHWERRSLDQLQTCLYRSKGPISRSETRFKPVNDVRISMIKDTPRPSQESNARAEGLLRFFIDGH
jgi:hypothetical protein